MITSTYPPPIPVDPDAYCRARDCARHLGISLSTWWRWVNEGRIKRPLKLGPKTSVWTAGYIRELQRELTQQQG